MTDTQLQRRSFLAAVLGGAGFLGGSALTVMGPVARAQSLARRTCITDSDETDLPDYGTMSGLTDSDATDLPGRGFLIRCESQTYTGLTDADPSDQAGYGRGGSGVYVGYSDSDPTDQSGYGRGRNGENRSGYTDSDPDDVAGTGRGDTQPPPAVAQFPVFPWPPPRASAQVVLERARYFSFSDVQDPTLGHVADRLTGALDARGYAERSFYQISVDRVLRGFALVARLERYSPDGSSLEGPDRFVEPGGDTNFSLADYVSGLFFAPRGNYRLIVFVVTDEVFVTRGELTQEEASELLEEGANTILARIRAMPFKDGVQVTALIYEYERGQGDDDISQRLPLGQLDALSHLRAARLIVGRRLAS